MEKTVNVTLTVKIKIDETKFTEEFMQEFSSHFYQFETINEHIEHLAQMYARGLFQFPSHFIEGYGQAKDMGIDGCIVDSETEIID